MRHRPLAVYEDDRETTLTGMQVDGVHAPAEVLHDLAAEIVLFGVPAAVRGLCAVERSSPGGPLNTLPAWLPAGATA